MRSAAEYVRFRDSDRNHAVGAGRRAVKRRQPRMDVAVQLVVQIEIALVLQGGAAGGTLEAVGVQVLVLDAHKHAAAPRIVSVGCGQMTCVLVGDGW